MSAPVFFCTDGGRAQAGFQGTTGDCATRAIAIAAQIPYAEVYAHINDLAKAERPTARRRRSNARTGVHSALMHRYLVGELGWTWTPTMQIGSGCTVHVTPGELPADGFHILRLSRHYAAWIGGALFDNHDSSRDGERCVYGIWTRP